MENVDLQLGFSEDESVADDDRSDEIKKALTQLDETFQDDDESLHSLCLDEVNQKHGSNDNSTTSSTSSLRGIGVDLENGNGGTSNGNGISKKVRFHSPKSKVKGGRQTDRGEDEIEVQNPTLSLLHKNHCPQHNGTETTTTKQNQYDSDKLYAVIALRERQVQQLELDKETYAKDKRSLNHQIGLMKTEMNQMKNLNDELHKVLMLKDEEIDYLKTKMTEALEEYDQVRAQEAVVREESDRYADEVHKLQQQVEMLSSIGSSLQTSSMNDVVRQIRDKHSKEISAWQATAAELESQLQVYKRTQQNSLNESLIIEKENKASQTEYQVVLKPRLVDFGQVTVKPTMADFGQVTVTPTFVDFGQVTEKPRLVDFGQSVNFIHDLNPENQRDKGAGDGIVDTIIRRSSVDPENKTIQKWKDAVLSIEEEKNRLKDYYERLINEYRNELATLPSQLHTEWTKKQEEFGLSLTLSNSQLSPAKPISPELSRRNNWTQTDTVAHFITDEHRSSRSTSVSRSSSNPDEHRSVVCQTEETLETFEVLGEVIQSWAKEVAVSAKRAEVAEKETAAVTNKFHALQEAVFKMIKREKHLRHKYEEQKLKYEEQKDKYLYTLNMVTEKLNVVELEPQS